MTVLVFVMLLVCIAMPLFYAWRIARLDAPSISAWLLLAADAAVFVALILLVGRWDIAGYHIRFAVLAIFLAAIIWSLWRHRSRPWMARGEPTLRRHWTTLTSLVLFGGILAYVVYGLLPPDRPRELAFPLEDGRFMVGQGGSVSLLNHHAGHREQRYAADITAIGPLGFRAAGLAPAELDRYEIYGKPVVSPCPGVAVATRNDLPDLVPPESDPDNARGNHVVIDCGGFNVELAHLQGGSVAVAAGQSLAAGDTLGRVGNSGNTTEPHLHVHALDPETGVGLPMSFGGRIPVRNSLYVN